VPTLEAGDRWKEETIRKEEKKRKHKLDRKGLVDFF
jgi:hypothetical protein